MIEKYYNVFGKEVFYSFKYSNLSRDRFMLTPFNLLHKIYISYNVLRYFFENNTVNLIVEVGGFNEKKIINSSTVKKLNKLKILNNIEDKQTFQVDFEDEYYCTSFLIKDISFLLKLKTIYLSMISDKGGPDANYVFIDDELMYAMKIFDDRGLDVLRNDIEKTGD